VVDSNDETTKESLCFVECGWWHAGGIQNTFEIGYVLVGLIRPFILFQNEAKGRMGARDGDSEVLGVFDEGT
jgi:hypothetical protein